MTGVVRFYGVIGLLGGFYMAYRSATILDMGTGLTLGAAYLLAGVFTLAFCNTLADTSDRTAAIAKHLGLSVRDNDSFKLRRPLK